MSNLRFSSFDYILNHSIIIIELQNTFYDQSISKVITKKTIILDVSILHEIQLFYD